MKFFVALRKELLELWRSYRLLILAVVFVLFGLLSPASARFIRELVTSLTNDPAIAQLIPPPTMAEAVGQYVKNLSQFGVILALLLTMGEVAREKDKGTAALILAKPLPRGAFLGAKFAALALGFAASLVVAGAGAYYYTAILFEPPDPLAWLEMNGLLLLFFLIYVAVTLFCSTVSKSAVVAGGLAFGIVIVLSVVGSIPRIGEYFPGQLTTWGAMLATGAGGSFWPAVAVAAGLIVAALGGAWAIFERQEI